MQRWGVRGLCLGVGWHMAMSYPKDDTPASLFLSLLVGTLGVVWVAITAYCAGREDAHDGAGGE